MTDSNPLAVALADAALREASTPAQAISGLMTGASLILDRDLGAAQAAQVMLNMIVSLHSKLAEAGIVSEPTSH